MKKKILLFSALLHLLSASFSANCNSHNGLGLLRGTVDILSPCFKDDAMIWISKNESPNEMLFHLHTKPKGTFRFNLLPGNYLVKFSTPVTTSTYCKLEEAITIIAGKELKKSWILKP